MFDRTVHIRNPKTGKITVNPYRQICENGVIYLERNGVKYYEDGSLVDKPQIDIIEPNLGLPSSLDLAETDAVAAKKRK